ncbi:hypothetical protein GQ53DRAFT_734003 [Thozetella sp. PMI_491]|nr:hypothetical protein GQ53DRAFT_734003 [Thozetella sp. PMI_491]
MKTSTPLFLALSGLASAGPIKETRQTQPWQITGFFASKIHNSGTCNYSFNVTAPGLSQPAQCRASADAGFSGATWLAMIYQGIGNCDNDAVTWTFFDPTSGGDAQFNVTIGGVTGMYTVPEADIKINLNNETNPFDNDVYYGGPKDFCIDTFVQA